MMNVKSATPNIFEVDDHKLIEKFVQGSDRLLATANLRLEVNAGVSQLLTRSGDPIAIMYLQNKPRTLIVKHSCQFSELIDRLSTERDFVMFGDASRAGFIEYKHYVTPAGYKILYTEPAILWKKWWPTEKFQDKQRFNMDILVSVKHNWYPVQNINVNAGIFTIKTIAGQLVLKRDGKVLWLAQSTQALSPEQLPIQPDVSPITVAQQPNQTVSSTPIHASSASDLTEKIQRKQSAIDPDRAWTMIKQLEEKLQSQIKLNTETEAKLNRAESRTIVAEQRLQVIYKYLKGIGIDPQDIYSGKKNN
jgi:hypothetical protein